MIAVINIKGVCVSREFRAVQYLQKALFSVSRGKSY